MEFPHLKKLVEKYTSKGFVLVTINTDAADEATAKLIMDKQKYGFLNLQAPEKWAWKTYGIGGVPATYLLDPNGNIIFTHVGMPPDVDDTFASEIEALLARAQKNAI